MTHEQPAAGASCIVCSGQTDQYCDKDQAKYRICRSCGLIFQHPLPTRGSMVEYADEEYASGVYREYVDSRPMKIHHFDERLNDVAGLVRPGRLLDVGCSCGYFMEVTADRGYTVRGLEFSRNAIAAARPDMRAAIFEGSLENLPDEPPFDVVSAFDIIEHMPDPRAFLRSLATRLKPGGIVLISTPDTGHFLRYVMGSRWPMLQPLQHLHLFSRDALDRLLRSEGFEVIRTSTAFKTISIEYLVNQIRPLNPLLFRVLSALMAPMPASTARRYRRVNIGEILSVGRRT